MRRDDRGTAVSAPPAESGPPLAASLRRLARVRSREIRVRLALLVWCAVTFAWLLPVGPVSPTTGSLTGAIAVGALLAVCGVALVVAHGRVSNTSAIKAAIGAAVGVRPQSVAGGRVDRLLHGARRLIGARPRAIAWASVPRATATDPFHALVQRASDATLILDADGAVRYASPSVTRILGYQPESLVRSSFFALVHPDDAGWMLNRYLECLDTPGESTAVEFLCRSDGGAWRHLESTFNNLLADPGVNGVVVTCRDVTERRRDEESLRQSEQRFRSLVQNSSDVITILDRDGVRRYVSSSVERLFGVAPARFIGTSYFDTLHEDDGPRVRAAFAEVAAHPGASRTLEYRRRGRNGTWLHLEGVFTNLLDEPTVNGIVVTSRDITARKQAEQALYTAEARYRGIFENAIEGIFQTDAGGCFLTVNPATARMVGYSSPEEFMAAAPDLSRFFADVGRLDELMRSLHERGVVTNFEFQARGRDGGTIWVSLNAGVLRDADGSTTGIEGLAADITERKRAEEDLQRSLEMLRRTDDERRKLLSRVVAAQEDERRRIAGDIHDDSVQAMTAVGIRLHTLRRQMTGPDQVKRLEELERTVGLAITRLRGLIFNLRPSALDRDTLTAALEMYLERENAETGLAFRIDDRLTSEPPTETRVILYRIAQEALANVRKHAQASTVDVVLAERDGGFLVRIQDDGVGFAHEQVEQPRPGHLGLMAMRARAEMAGGWWRIESARARGTTVEFWVPGEPRTVLSPAS